MPSTIPSLTRLRLCAAAVAATVATLGAAGTAAALDAPTSAASVPGSPSNVQGPWAFSWAEVIADPGFTITGYVGGVVAPGAPDPTTPIAQGHAAPVPEGASQFRVAAVQSDGVNPPVTGPYLTLPLTADYTPPSFSIGLVPATPNGTNDWYVGLRVDRTCADAGVGIAGACTDTTWTADGEFGAVAESLADLVGNTAGAQRPPFKFDATIPAPGQPSGPGFLVADEPTFQWTRGEDATSGVARYELQFKLAGAPSSSYATIARVTHPVNSVADFFEAKRDPDLRAAPLPTLETLKWRVRTFDRAGNVELSDESEVRIDPTVPPAPTITGGPAAPTRVTSPTFTWTGDHPTFLWDLTPTGSVNPIRSGGGPQTQVTIPNLSDGDYTFRVSQVTEAGRPSAEAARAFKVDTTAPPPPTITVRPPFPAISAPVFGWQTETGAFSRWVVLGEGGEVVIPSSDTPTTRANLPSLADGAYSFQVRQVDAAGNVSAPAVEPFSMQVPLTPAPAPSAGSAAAFRLPSQNAKRLRPRRGKTLPTRSPVLQWTRGPRGTKLYNLQIFRVIKRKGTTPRIAKILSRFPRKTQFRAPKRKLRPSTCYVWRVWPYTGRSFTPKPVGVSNFCVASPKVLKRKAAQARARKIAAARRAALARARKAAARR